MTARGAAAALAILWGILTAALPIVALPEPPPLRSLAGVWAVSALSIVLGVLVARGRPGAAWALVGYALCDVLRRIVFGLGGILIPVLLVLFALRAAASQARPDEAERF